MNVDKPTVTLLTVFLFYLIGLFAIPNPDIGRAKRLGIIKQECETYIDNEGEEHEYEPLMEIVGYGHVLGYKDIYISTIPFLLVSCILAKIIFNSTDELRFMIYTNCILGLLLIILTSRQSILSTILYWCGIFTASYILHYDE